MNTFCKRVEDSQMANLHGFEPFSVVMTVRFVQGYRYIDRCGEALIKLEKALGELWIPDEISPSGGSFRNDALSMNAQFDSEHLTVTKTDVVDLDEFHDPTCKIFEILCKTFEIEIVNAPALRIAIQKGCESIEDGYHELMGFGFAKVSETVTSRIGMPTALDVVICTEKENEVFENMTTERTRFSTKVVQQLYQPPFDKRLMKRVRLLSQNQKEAMNTLLNLRSKVKEVPQFAIELDLELALESEFSVDRFDMARFVEQSWASIVGALGDFTRKG